jgi:NH3-dependent NAD+ synthetase
LGFKYQEADKILRLFFEDMKSEQEIIQDGLNETLLKNVLLQVKKNEFKRTSHHTQVVA